LTEESVKRRATVHDVARAAGVSLATVDRVLNGRRGVRTATAAKVEEAIAEIGFTRDLNASLMARSRDLHLVFFIPEGTNEFMESLADAVSRRVLPAQSDRIHLELVRIKAFDGVGLADRLNTLDAKTTDYAVIVSGDEPEVISAIDAAHRRGVSVITLVSDLPLSARRNFIGVDNVAAGRTAASLMGRFLPDGGKVGVVAGSLHLRDHLDRLEGFHSVTSSEFPQLEILGPREGHDERSLTQAYVSELIQENQDLAGIYNLGAGNAGLVAALEASERGDQIKVIAHELTSSTRLGLLGGTIDVVLDQNPDGEIREVIAAARSLTLSGARPVHNEPIEIAIFLRDNLR
jgi:LacI family transcriptional regulator